MDFDLPTREVDFDDEGEYRWPYGLLNRRAWRFPARPPLEEISRRPFAMDAASGIVPLTDEEASKVMQLDREEVELLLPIRARARIEDEEAARRRAASPPTTTRTGVMHLRRGQFNLYALPQLDGLRYQTRLQHLWGTARAAFEMEQAILHQFDGDRHPANREVIFGVRYEALEAAWIAYHRNERG